MRFLAVSSLVYTVTGHSFLLNANSGSEYFTRLRSFYSSRSWQLFRGTSGSAYGELPEDPGPSAKPYTEKRRRATTKVKLDKNRI